MPHVYDAGEALPQRTAIRNAIVTRLALLTRPGLYLEAVGMLPMRVSGDESGQSEISLALNGRSPAVLVALGGGEGSSAGMTANHARITIEAAVYVASGNRRGIVEGRLANDARATADVEQDPGIETMLEHVEELLLGWDLGIPGVEELRLQSESEIVTAEDTTVWEVLFSVRVDRTANHNRFITTLLTEIDARHEIDGVDPTAPEAVTRTTLLEAP